MSLLRLFPSSSTLRPACVYASFSTSKSAAKAAQKATLRPLKTPAPAAATVPQSSCVANTTITGVNYLKDQPQVLALPDEEYPSWLWTVLQPKVYEDDGPGGKLERVTRRELNRKKIKDRNFMQTQ